MRDDDGSRLRGGDQVYVRAVVCEPPRMAGYPHIARVEPSATGNGLWLDLGTGRIRYSVWLPFGEIEVPA